MKFWQKLKERKLISSISGYFAATSAASQTVQEYYATQDLQQTYFPNDSSLLAKIWRPLSWVGAGCRFITNFTFKAPFSYVKLNAMAKKLASLREQNCSTFMRDIFAWKKIKGLPSELLYLIVNLLGATRASIGTVVGGSNILPRELLPVILVCAASDGLQSIFVESAFLKNLFAEIKQKFECPTENSQYFFKENGSKKIAEIAHYDAKSIASKITWLLCFALLGGSCAAIQVGYSHIIFKAFEKLFELDESLGLTILRYAMMASSGIQNLGSGGAAMASFFAKCVDTKSEASATIHKKSAAAAFILALFSAILPGSAGFLGGGKIALEFSTSADLFLALSISGAALRILQSSIMVEMRRDYEVFKSLSNDPTASAEERTRLPVTDAFTYGTS